MKTLDIVVLVVLVLSAGFAYARGFVREVLSIVAWVGAAAIGLYGYPRLAPLMDFLPPGTIRNVAAGAAIFVVALIILSIITGTIARKVSQSGLSSLDRVFGLLFGLVRGAILLCLGYLALMWWYHDQPQPKWVTGARSQWFLAQGAMKIQSLAPDVLGPRAKTIGASGVNLRTLISPEPVAKPTPDAPAYNQNERNGMNRLIDQQQGQH